jgi:hypothetical protein
VYRVSCPIASVRFVTWCDPSYSYVTVPFSGFVALVRSVPVYPNVRVCVPLLRGIDTSLRANIDETVPPVVITEQGENRNQVEEQRNIYGFSHGFACR